MNRKLFAMLAGAFGAAGLLVGCATTPSDAEVSAKVRTGPPVDDEPDYDRPIWAGVLPVRQVADPPVLDDRLDPSLDPPTHVATWHRPTREGVTTRS